MKITAQKTGTRGRPQTPLGGLDADTFLRTYWQKKPLLIRQAFADFVQPFGKKELLQLAARDDAESRLICRSGGQWRLQSGPIGRRELQSVKGLPWTVLVQDTQHFSAAAHAVLAAFRFIPHARVDDLMVSYAVAGAGVGPHLDSYDVFLLQGAGRRRWRIATRPDLRLQQGQPLKLLARFKPEQEFVLECGDMLYLPPGVAHDGIAETDCQTWSVGFRAPSQQELSAALLDFLRDELHFDDQYADPDLTATRHPGLIDRATGNRLLALLRGVQAAVQDRALLARCLGRYLTEPKPHVFFDLPEPRLSAAAFRRQALQRGVMLCLKSRLLYDEQRFFINGGEIELEPMDQLYFRALADSRQIDPRTLALAHGQTLFAALYAAYGDGHLELADTPP